jgi:hypothetical protein
MRNIYTEKQLYVELARRGDPSAFYALFYDHIRNLYILMRSQGKDHQAVCADAAQVVAGMYRKFIRRTPVNPQKWFEAGCGLKKFEAGAVRVDNATEADIGVYGRLIAAALNKVYGELLEKGSDGKGHIRNRRPAFLYIFGSLAAVGLIAFFFFSETVASVSFGRFDSEYRISFPDMAKRLWGMSGLIRTNEEADTRRINETVPAGRQIEAKPASGHE